MGIRMASTGISALSDLRILDMMDPPEYSTSIAGSNTIIRRGGMLLAAGPNIPPLWEGSAGPPGLSKLNGVMWSTLTSAAATVKYRNTARYPWPIGCDFSAAPVNARQPMRYRMEAVVLRTTPVGAVVPLAFGVVFTGGGQRELSDTTSEGVELVSRSDLNGGRWTVRKRLVTAGALTVVQDSGVDPNTTPYVHLVLQLSMTDVPSLSFFINGVECGVMSGAGIPVGSGSLQTIGISQGLTVGGGAGQVDRIRQNRMTIDQLTNFPT